MAMLIVYLDSPGWYRSEARIIKNSIRSYAPDGLFWLVLDGNKKVGTQKLNIRVFIVIIMVGFASERTDES